jgi:hypothetical protein
LLSLQILANSSTTIFLISSSDTPLAYGKLTVLFFKSILIEPSLLSNLFSFINVFITAEFTHGQGTILAANASTLPLRELMLPLSVATSVSILPLIISTAV